ncbi:hypothetical protein GE061_014311 [Apolygus lucorum]|uniref:Uncharacterized protein n=1 Tax=Apolygus lucorum TaxID=248454 RepID=A0A8S9XSY2_APOLU|nr:hypothetical protein GE061_014311 [Apolygus lucorum]
MGADIEIEVNDEERWVSFGDYLAAPDADRLSLPSHLRCAAHTTALTSTSDVLKTINSNPTMKELHKTSLEKCNVLWKKANRPKSAEVMEMMMKKSLSRPNDTGWNSLYDAFNQILQIRASMEELVQKLNLPERDILSDEEYSYIEEYVKCSATVAEALDLLQGEKAAYYGMLVPTILVVKKNYDHWLTQIWNSVAHYLRPTSTAFNIGFQNPVF